MKRKKNEYRPQDRTLCSCRRRQKNMLETFSCLELIKAGLKAKTESKDWKHRLKARTEGKDWKHRLKAKTESKWSIDARIESIERLVLRVLNGKIYFFLVQFVMERHCILKAWKRQPSSGGTLTCKVCFKHMQRLCSIKGKDDQPNGTPEETLLSTTVACMYPHVHSCTHLTSQYKTTKWWSVRLPNARFATKDLSLNERSWSRFKTNPRVPLTVHRILVPLTIHRTLVPLHIDNDPLHTNNDPLPMNNDPIHMKHHFATLPKLIL